MHCLHNAIHPVRTTEKTKGKVEQANESLSYHLYEIQQMNSILADNNKIKEEYVGLYMEQYTSYISKIANFKKRALKIAKSEDIKKVTSFLHSSLNTEEDLAEFYNNFDKAISISFRISSKILTHCFYRKMQSFQDPANS